MSVASRCNNRGFSLIELVIVVVIIGIIGAIAVPRMSRGAKGATDSALIANLSVIRNALDLFATEHGGVYPQGADVSDALTQFSDLAGEDFSTSKDASHLFGPYLRAVPKLPVGANKGETEFIGTAPTATAVVGGWYYNTTTGGVSANCKDSEADDAGVAYNTY